MIKALVNEFVKNVKLMFRNVTSLSMLIIAPVVLILLIGYAFSGDQLSGIQMGVVVEDSFDLSILEKNISSYAGIVRFTTTESCISDMSLQKIHICLELEGLLLSGANLSTVGMDDLPTGKITYYYDNTRKKVSVSLVQALQDFFGLAAEQISIENAESIIGEIQNLLAYISERKNDIGDIKVQAESIKEDLIKRKESLILVRENFMPTYDSIKLIQKDLHNQSLKLNSSEQKLAGSQKELMNSLYRFENLSLEILDALPKDTQLNISLGELPEINDTLNLSIDDNITSSVLDKTNLTLPNLTLFPIKKNISLSESSNLSRVSDEISYLVSDIGLQMMLFSNLTDATVSDIEALVSKVDVMVLKLDAVKNTLDSEISSNEEYIRKIDQSVETLEKMVSELDEKIEDLGALHPEMAEDLVHPIAQHYSLLLKDTKNIQISFPLLCVIIILFISLLFSNISALMEIHDNAYLRNLVAPVNDLIYVIGLWLTSVVIIFFQVIVLFIVAQTKLGITILPVFWELSLMTILLISVFVLVGMIFAYLFKTVQGSILITTFSVLLFFLFGNTLSPIEAMPSIAGIVSSYNPVVIGEFLIKQVQLFGTPLALLMPKILLLAAYSIILFFVLAVLAKYRNSSRT